MTSRRDLRISGVNPVVFVTSVQGLGVDSMIRFVDGFSPRIRCVIFPPFPRASGVSLC